MTLGDSTCDRGEGEVGEAAGGEDGGGGEGGRPGHQALQGVAQVPPCAGVRPSQGGSQIAVSEETFCGVKR